MLIQTVWLQSQPLSIPPSASLWKGDLNVGEAMEVSSRARRVLVLTLTLFCASAESKASTRVISGNLGIQSPPKPKYQGAKPQPWQHQVAGLCPHSWKWPSKGSFPLSSLPAPPSPPSPAAKTLLPTPCTWLPLEGGPRPLVEDKLPPTLSSCQAWHARSSALG